MKKESLSIKERRFILTLWMADDTLEKRTKELCELAELSVSFALNSIPVANIVPLLGQIVNTKKEYHSDLDIILELTRKRTPVIITVQVAQTFSSDSNKSDKQYWNVKTKGYPDAFGIYKSDYLEIFKGYLQPPTTEVTAVGAGLTIPVVHWLADLAEISLYTTAMQLGTTAELALQQYGLGNATGVWNITPKLKIKNGIGDIWYNGIKVVFDTILARSNNDKNNRQFEFIKNKRERAQRAIDRIEASDALQLGKKWAQWHAGLTHAIAICLGQEDYRQFAQVSAWNKLISVYSPQFLFSLVPRVQNALLIPTPTVIYKDEAIEITNSEIFRVRSAPVTTNQVSKVICFPSSPIDYTGNLNGRPRFHAVGHYPPDKDMKNRVGFVKTIVWPEWISRSAPRLIHRVSTQNNLHQNPKEKDAALKLAQRNEVELRATQRELGASYAKYAYLVSAFNTTSAVIVTPVRPDIAPGAMVKFHTKIFGNEDAVFYGTVSGIQLHFTAGDRPSTTTLTLTNIRDSQSIDDEVDNPQTGVGFYERQYTGR